MARKTVSAPPKPSDGDGVEGFDKDRIRDSVLGRVSASTFDRLRAAGEFPEPDMLIGRRPIWFARTVRAWADARAKEAAHTGRPVRLRAGAGLGTPSRRGAR
jgi:predicted DNA-binding transcriptional regulator AlpA